MKNVVKYDIYLDTLLMVSIHVIKSSCPFNVIKLMKIRNAENAQIDCKVARHGSEVHNRSTHWLLGPSQQPALLQSYLI